MLGFDPADLELTENWIDGDPDAHWRDAFPYAPEAPGATDVAARELTVVYFELDPGRHLGTHVDSAEEVFVVLEGEVEATAGDETTALAAGEMTLVPAMVPHSVANVGDGVARVVGVFPTSAVTSTFDERVEPFGTRVFGAGAAEGDEA